MAMSGARSRNACATPLTMLVAPGPRVDMQMPGLPVISPQVAASMAPATSCFINRKRIWRWRAASISSTDSPPGCPTINGVPASLNAVASTSTVVVIAEPPDFFGNDCAATLPEESNNDRARRASLRPHHSSVEGAAMQRGHDRRDFIKKSLVLAGSAGLLASTLGRNVAKAQTLGPMRRSNRYEDTFIHERRPVKWPGNKTRAGWI